MHCHLYGFPATQIQGVIGYGAVPAPHYWDTYSFKIYDPVQDLVIFEHFDKLTVCKLLTHL